jgi:hypothetical protein
VAQFDRLSPEASVDVLGAWLANPPSSATAPAAAGKRAG